MEKIFFVSLGCDKNLVDSEIMLGLMDEEGYIITTDEAQADIIIINTCGFIMDATEEGIENILELARYKKNGSCKGLIVTGCMAQRYEADIFEQLPEVDAVVGTGDFEKIGDVVRAVLAGNQVTLITDKNRTLSESAGEKRILTTPGHFAYLKIAEGCDNHCTYCTIPSLRGKYSSRSMESLLREGERLAAKGVVELILVAQDTALYGNDLYGKPQLEVLLRKLAAIEGIQWIRIMYCYPEHITGELIDEMARNPKVCHYLDMPIQHGHDGILKKMGRKSNRKQLMDVIGRLRRKIPDICLRTTLIVGFPGETEKEFQSLCDFIKHMNFDRLGVFAYSREEGTPAYLLPGQVPEDIKQARKNEIMQIQEQISERNLMERTGQVLPVMVEGKLPEEDVYCGRSYMDCYEVDGMVFFPSEREYMAGEFVPVLIQEVSPHDMYGVVVGGKDDANV